MATFTALYDACVLYPAPLRDLLVSLGGLGIIRARWTDQIHEEWINNLLLNRTDLSAQRLERTRALMNLAVPDCLVTGYEALIPSLVLPDQNDRHVLAAAIRGRADVIVTTNLKDFPEERLAEFGIDAQHPDDFLMYVFDLYPGPVCETVKRMRERLKNPTKTIEELLATFDSLGLVTFVAHLREYEGVL